MSRKIFYTENIQFVFFCFRFIFSSVSLAQFIEKKIRFSCSVEKILTVLFRSLAVFSSSACVYLYLGKGEQSDHLNLVATRQNVYICAGNMYVQNDKWHRLKGNECTFRKDDQQWTSENKEKIKTSRAVGANETKSEAERERVSKWREKKEE